MLFAREGASVFCVDIRGKAADETRDIIRAEGGTAEAWECDVSQSGEVEAMVDGCMAQHGRIDVLQDNVGILAVGGPVETSEFDWDRVHAVNLKSMFLACKYVLPVMEQQGSGSIVNISSIAGLRYLGVPYVAYNSSKAAVSHFTRMVAVQYAPGIRCNSVAPGFMRTPMVEKSLADHYADGDIDEMFRIRAAQVPMGRGGDAWDVAYASLYLASDEAKYVTGAEIVVDGGLTVKCVERCKFLPRKSPSSSPVKSYSRSSRISAHNASAYRPGGGPRRTLGGRSGSERSIERSGSAKTVAPQAAVGYPIRARTAKKEILVDTKMTGVGKSIFRRVASILAIALAWTTLLGVQAAPAREWKWYKGNLHAHTINSDGDSTPDSVVRWYKEQRYNFLVLNDHNFVTETEGLNSIFGAKDRFLVITGEEVTSKIDGTSVYVNALNLRSTVMPAVGNSPFETLQKNIDAIQKAGGVPWLNAPGFTWSLTPKQLKQLRNVKLLEIYNGHPRVNNLGGGTFAGLEEQWDVMLSAGREFYGVAVDDAHDFKRSGPELANPGRGWICIKAPELSLGAVLDALNSGEFYASTGVELEALSRLPNGLRIKMREEDWIRYTVEFIGHGGKILKKTSDNPAEYFLQPGDQYVRARITASNFRRAWVQPVFGK